MSSTVEKIKDRLTIEEVVGSYIKLDRAGANLKGKCPFHNEKTPSFFVSPERNSYYCFGCGAKGDIFSFVQEFERVDFMGALKLLADKAGIEIEKSVPGVKNEKERLYAVLEETTNFFSSNLERNTAPKEYLLKRGLKEETIKDWRLGYVRDEWNSLENHLKAKGFSQIEMEKAGLIKKGDKGSYYDRFRGRVMFPLFDPSGRVVGFSGRILVETSTATGEPAAKYLNSPETELFLKSSLLYGYHKAKNDIRIKDYSILVEGQMDLLMSHQEGFRNTVATSGTALTSAHLEILKRLSSRVMVVYDADQAGVNASLKAWQTALALGMDVKIAQLPAGFDPADILLRDKEEWREALKNSKHIITFCLEAIMLKKLDERKLGMEVEQTVLPYVRALESNIEQSHFISAISHRTGIKEDALWQELRKIPTEVSRPEAEAKRGTAPPGRINSLERKIIGIMLWQERTVDGKAPPEASPDRIRERLARIMGEENAKEHIALYTNEKEELAFETETYYQDASKLSEEVEELFLSLEEEYLKQAFTKKMMELTRAEREEDPGLVHRLLEECQDISKRLAALYTSNK